MNQPKIVTMKLDDLAAAPYNPRKIGPKAMRGLQESISEFGLVQPIVWNKKTRRVVGGHQRVRALKALGETEAAVMVVDLDEKKEKALNLTLNNPKIEGEFTSEVDALLAEIQKDLPAVYRNLCMGELERSETKTRRRDGSVVFTEELMESQNYVVLYFDNQIDWQQLLTLFPLPSVKSLDSRKGFEKIGIGRVIKGADFLKKVGGL